MKILLVHQGLQSFVQKDLDILRAVHQVVPMQFTGREDLARNLLPDLWRLWKGVRWCDFTFSWFGKLHAFFAVLFSRVLGKKAIVVAGGDDVVLAPEINYGMFSFWWKKWCPLFVYKHADMILPPSEFHKRLLLDNAKPDLRKVKMINHGFDHSKFKMNEGRAKNGSVITVGGVTEDNLVRKGLELFIKSAAFLPDVKFLLIGPQLDSSIKKLERMATPNVKFTGGLYGDDLIEIMNGATVYVQVSEYEGFGCSLAEAMLCECIPVVSRKTAIPMVVGNTGIYVDNLTAEAVAAKIKEALYAPEVLGKKARERIVNLFPFKKRKEDLIQAVNSLSKIK